MNFLLTAALLATAAHQVSAQATGVTAGINTGGSVTTVDFITTFKPNSTYPALGNGMFLHAWNGYSAVGKRGNTVEYTYFSVPFKTFDNWGSVDTWTVSSNGLPSVRTTAGATNTITAGATNTVGSSNCQFNIVMSIGLTILCDQGKTWDSGVVASEIPLWAYSLVTSHTWEIDNIVELPDTYGNNTSVYVMDSGVDGNTDPSRSLYTNWSRSVKISTNVFKTADTDFVDELRHGSRIAAIIKSRYFGIAKGANLFSIKLSNNDARTFNERDVVEAMRFVSTHQNNVSLRSKIINFSGRFNPLRNQYKCAVQWVARSGVLVVAAAGNDNSNYQVGSSFPQANPFQLTVAAVFQNETINNAIGSGFGYPASITNYGPWVDVWGPGMFIEPVYAVGSSIAAAFATSVAAATISNWPSLFLYQPAKVITQVKDKGFAGNAYTYMSDINSIKLSSTGRDVVSTRAVKNNWLATGSPAFDSTTTGYCNLVNSGLPTANPTAANWDTLIAASSTNNANPAGEFVTSYLCGGRIIFTPC